MPLISLTELDQMSFSYTRSMMNDYVIFSTRRFLAEHRASLTSDFNGWLSLDPGAKLPPESLGKLLSLLDGVAQREGGNAIYGTASLDQLRKAWIDQTPFEEENSISNCYEPS